MVLVMTLLIYIFGRDGGKLDKTNFDFWIFRHANDTHLTRAVFGVISALVAKNKDEMYIYIPNGP
jgi:hypothetical protein